MSIPTDIRVLASVFAGVGVLHFVAPKQFEEIVPKPLPLKKELVYASGAVELATAGLLVNPRTRQEGGRLALALLTAIWPANMQMSIDAHRTKPRWFFWGTVARLPLQLPMMWVAWKASKGRTADA